jgi:hypothetical protein
VRPAGIRQVIQKDAGHCRRHLVAAGKAAPEGVAPCIA